MTPIRSALRRLPLLALTAGLASAASPKAWFRADSISGTEGSAVNLWSDSSRNGNVAQAGTAPTLDLNALNGMPVVKFTGTQSLVFPRPVQDDFTILVLFRSNGGGIGSASEFYSGAGIVSGEAPGVVNDYGTSMRANGRILAGVGNPDIHIRTPVGVAYNDGQPHVMTFTRERTSGEFNLYADRVEWATGFGNTQSLSIPSQLCIGAQPGPYNFLVGDIAEVIVLGEYVSGATQLLYEDALRGKYGMANGTVPLVPEAVIANGTRVSWQEAIGARSYRVLRSNAINGSYTEIASNLSGAQFTDPAPLGGSNFYKVVAVNPVGASAASTAAEGISPVLPANGPIRINEIHYNGGNNAIHSDFVEFYNYSTSPANIGGWEITGGVDYVFPAGTVIPAGGYLVVAEDPATIQALWGATALGPYENNLSSEGEAIRLRNPAGDIIAEVSYSSGFPWPCAANGEGASAELVHPALDPAKGSSWRSSVVPAFGQTGEIASPGAQNFQFTLNAAPNIEQVGHSPQQPSSSTPITVTARPSDADGLGAVQLSYQIVQPGNHIPARLPLPINGGQIDTSQPRPENPAFENPANWTTVAMNDNGTGGDAVAGDGLYSAQIPAQAHRTLVRYRVTATDLTGKSVRAPFADDESRNFACFVYNGVPAYQGISSATLNSLPTYHFLTRKADYDQCVAYNSSDQLAGNSPAWTFENWDATLVFDGVVYDHIKFRLHGGNGRYYYSGKRAFRFFFNEGYDFQNKDEDGRPYPTKWNSLTTENGWENRGTLTYSLNEKINFHLWQKIGIPAPRSNWGHFRTITTAAEQTDAFHGDFWGLIFIHEDYDARFLDSHGMEKGNLYKLTRDATDGLSQQRYQAPDAVANGADHYNIFTNLTTDKNDAFINRYVNVGKWSTYHALCQAVRHYDYWPTGDNNGAYYFEPDFTDQTDNLGKLWVLPNDVDATWGPTWNEGKDKVYSAIFDSPANPGLYAPYFNAVREVRDLLWRPDQINPLLDELAAQISPFIAADSLRWKNAPADAGNYNGLGGAGATSLAALVQDMKNFAFVGGSWPDQPVGAGGRAAFLDTLQLGVSNSEGATKPVTPTITYQGPTGYPITGLTFRSSAFSDPQNPGQFNAIQWRIAEVTDASAPAHDPQEKFKLEWTAAYDSGPLPTFVQNFTFSGGICSTGHAYRVRVRHQDVSGRWSNWSSPHQFIAGPNPDDRPIVISELLYKPHDPSAAEIAAGFGDQEMFEYLELRNVEAESLELDGCYFDKGITYTFPNNTDVAPGASILLVSNPAAFAFRYGAGRPVVGTYTGNLSNSGERILLLSPNQVPLIDFTYDDGAPWPTLADSDGHSLVLVNPASRPAPGVVSNWSASVRPGGSPGVIDSFTYEIWAGIENVAGEPGEDEDGDGLSNGLEYALLTDPHVFTPPMQGAFQNFVVEGVQRPYVTISFRRRLNAEDLSYQVQYSADCSIWDNTAVMTSHQEFYDGSALEIWRAPVPATGGKAFMRVKTGP
ncbi:lamin tail domain-containing protein [Luteolibacter sp. GHJ8]|uniref:Lamin tail domain-containing protein n=1 Tax=Luteolibacter rhizosphaerae TaxID=2989719 RepID=A0ABT3FXQ9_9BACT|nr:lamin tail domain-containing protein [Luteolibacter rhizosphaerae]MCW1912348.1 lamin tail domain-containing protein [Luteolibacter rhizosphaerae]